jgi:hypothetical protein
VLTADEADSQHDGCHERTVARLGSLPQMLTRAGWKRPGLRGRPLTRSKLAPCRPRNVRSCR